MKRSRLQYAKDEIINNLYTPGNEYMIEGTDIEYTGPYHRYTTGEIFTEFNWKPNISKKLVQFKDTSTVQYQFQKINPTIKTSYEIIPYYIPTPTSADYKKGKLVRFFLKKINEFKIFEVNEDMYNKHSAAEIDPNLYTSLKIDWIISGIAKSSVKNGIYVTGVWEQNAKTVMDSELVMPSISKTLIDYLQFYVGNISGVIVPPDINQV